MTRISSPTRPPLEALSSLKAVLFADSHIRLCVADEQLALRILWEEGQPSEEELDLLVMGDDEGDVPEELMTRFPRLELFIHSFFDGGAEVRS